MFLCSKCKVGISLPKCSKCGNEHDKIDGVWQLSNMPDIVIEGDGDKYIGYEYIGENYSGNRKYIIESKDLAVAKEISEITGDGIFWIWLVGTDVLQFRLHLLGQKSLQEIFPIICLRC